MVRAVWHFALQALWAPQHNFSARTDRSQVICPTVCRSCVNSLEKFKLVLTLAVPQQEAPVSGHVLLAMKGWVIQR